MEEIIYYFIFFGIPILFFVLCIKNIIKIIKAKRNKEIVKKSYIIKSIIFGTILVIIVSFYIWIMYEISKAIAYM